MNQAVKKTLIWLLALAILASAICATLSFADGDATPGISAEAQFARARSALLYVRCYYASGSLKATGSGFLIAKNGLAATAAHVVDKAARVTVLTMAGEELDCTVVSADLTTDVALLRLPKGSYPALTIAKSAPASGATLRAMGYPAKDTAIITEGLAAAANGTVSDKERMLVTCDIVNGMSGGPVFDRYGQVVGLCSGSVRTMSGIHLAARWEDLNTAVQAASKA